MSSPVEDAGPVETAIRTKVRRGVERDQAPLLTDSQLHIAHRGIEAGALESVE